MKDIDKFFSNNYYVYIPTINNPKVILAVDNKIIKNYSFRLYNPFSKKAKIFKYILKNLCNLKFVCNKLSRKHKNSDFIKYLNKKFHREFISSIYISTEKDKVVLQLLSNNKIFGYVKYPLNEIGKKRLINEKKALDIFYNLGITHKYLAFDYFEDDYFIILEPIKGSFSIYKKDEILKFLDNLKKDKEYRLINHPRIKNLAQHLKHENVLYNHFLKTVNKSVNFYKLVFEHGDFAPWNIIKQNESLIAFDFEYFIEEGLEWLDFIKYYYNLGKLVKKYKGEKLINYVFNNFDIREKNILFQIFIFKEISMKIEENKNFEYEFNLLKRMGVI